MQDFFKQAIDDMAARSLRCVAIACRQLDLDSIPADEESLDKWALPEDDLALVAIVGIKVCTNSYISTYRDLPFRLLSEYMFWSMYNHTSGRLE